MCNKLPLVEFRFLKLTSHFFQRNYRSLLKRLNKCKYSYFKYWIFIYGLYTFIRILIFINYVGSISSEIIPALTRISFVYYQFFRYHAGPLFFVFIWGSIGMLTSGSLYRSSFKSNKMKIIILGIFIMFFCTFKLRFTSYDCGKWMFKIILNQTEQTWDYLEEEEYNATN